jgi:hypothetical protein
MLKDIDSTLRTENNYYISKADNYFKKNMPLFNINISDPTDQFNNLGCSAKNLKAVDIASSARTS